MVTILTNPYKSATNRVKVSSFISETHYKAVFIKRLPYHGAMTAIVAQLMEIFHKDVTNNIQEHEPQAESKAQDIINAYRKLNPAIKTGKFPISSNATRRGSID